MPEGATQLDWEAELAVIIGKEVKSIPERDALSAVFGYTVANDLSIRNLARQVAEAWLAEREALGFPLLQR